MFLRYCFCFKFIGFKYDYDNDLVVCIVCDKSFSSEFGYHGHKRHCKGKVWKCPYCKATWPNAQSLKAHQRFCKSKRIAKLQKQIEILQDTYLKLKKKADKQDHALKLKDHATDDESCSDDEDTYIEEKVSKYKKRYSLKGKKIIMDLMAAGIAANQIKLFLKAISDHYNLDISDLNISLQHMNQIARYQLQDINDIENAMIVAHQKDESRFVVSNVDCSANKGSSYMVSGMSIRSNGSSSSIYKSAKDKKFNHTLLFCESTKGKTEDILIERNIQGYTRINKALKFLGLDIDIFKQVKIGMADDGGADHLVWFTEVYTELDMIVKCLHHGIDHWHDVIIEANENHMSEHGPTALGLKDYFDKIYKWIGGGTHGAKEGNCKDLYSAWFQTNGQDYIWNPSRLFAVDHMSRKYLLAANSYLIPYTISSFKSFIDCTNMTDKIDGKNVQRCYEGLFCNLQVTDLIVWCLIQDQMYMAMQRYVTDQSSIYDGTKAMLNLYYSCLENIWPDGTDPDARIKNKHDKIKMVCDLLFKYDAGWYNCQEIYRLDVLGAKNEQTKKIQTDIYNKRLALGEAIINQDKEKIKQIIIDYQQKDIFNKDEFTGLDCDTFVVLFKYLLQDWPMGIDFIVKCVLDVPVVFILTCVPQIKKKIENTTAFVHCDLDTLESKKDILIHCMASNDSCERYNKYNSQVFKKHSSKSSQAIANLTVRKQHQNVQFKQDEEEKMEKVLQDNYTFRQSINRIKATEAHIINEQIRLKQAENDKKVALAKSRTYIPKGYDEFVLLAAQHDILEAQSEKRNIGQVRKILIQIKKHYRYFEFGDDFEKLSPDEKNLFKWSSSRTTIQEYNDIRDICILYNKFYGTNRWQLALSKETRQIFRYW